MRFYRTVSKANDLTVSCWSLNIGIMARSIWTLPTACSSKYETCDQREDKALSFAAQRIDALYSLHTFKDFI